MNTYSKIVFLSLSLFLFLLYIDLSSLLSSSLRYYSFYLYHPTAPSALSPFPVSSSFLLRSQTAIFTIFPRAICVIYITQCTHGSAEMILPRLHSACVGRSPCVSITLYRSLLWQISRIKYQGSDSPSIRLGRKRKAF